MGGGGENAMCRTGFWTAIRIALLAAGLTPISTEMLVAEEAWDRRSILLSGAAEAES